MVKYLSLAKATFQEYLTYRLNFILWRFRSFISFLALIFFWLAIYGTKESFLGYQKFQMLNYVVGVAFLRGIILSSRTADVAGQIRSGLILTRDLLKPWGIFKFWFTRDLVDKSLNLVFSLAEIGLVFYLFKFPLYFPKTIESFLFFFLICLISFFLYFFLSLWLSILAFWLDSLWAPRWLFGVVFLEFLAGVYFPLDVLPAFVAKLASLTPFPYLVYFPLKIWLGQVSLVQIIKVVIISLIWGLVFYFALKKTWAKGLKSYAAYGG